MAIDNDYDHLNNCLAYDRLGNQFFMWNFMHLHGKLMTC